MTAKFRATAYSSVYWEEIDRSCPFLLLLLSGSSICRGLLYNVPYTQSDFKYESLLGLHI